MAGEYSDNDSYDDYSNPYSDSYNQEYSDDESHDNYVESDSYNQEYSDDECYENYVESKTKSGEYSSDDDSYARGGYVTTYSGSQAKNQVSVHQQTYRVKNEHKQSGSYERFTVKDKTVRDEPFVDRYGNRGYKNEHTTTSNYKVGDKRGYTEYQREEKVKHVGYNKSSYGNNNKAVRPCSKYRKY